MTWFEFFQLVMNAVPAILAVLGGVVVAHRSYRDLQNTVAVLVEVVQKLKPETAKIAIVQRDMAVVQRDIALIKKDIATMRENQQAAAFGRPEKGKLEKLSTDEDAPKPVTEPPTELEGRVDDLEDGVIKDLRIHKVDDPPED